MFKKILVIEDDANLLAALQAKFSLLGYKIIADSGLNENELRDKITNLKPDFIILDLLLPKIDGFQMLKEIKSNQELSSIPVFVFTNLGDEESKNRCLTLGADIFLVKSDFALDEFVTKINKIIVNRSKLG